MKEADFSIQEQNITSDSIEFVLDTSEVDFNKTTAIKCKLNGKTKEVVDGKVKFDNLTNNTTYKYEFVYDTKDNKNIETLLTGEINSAKITPTFGDLTIEVVGKKVIFTPTINDPDEALDYYRIFIDNKRNPYLGEPIEVKYDVTGLKELEFDILICYNLNDGKGKQEFSEHVVYKLVEDEPPHEHTEEIIPAVDATCEEAGLTEGKKCSECGEILVPQNETPALGHNFEDGECTICDEKDPDYVAPEDPVEPENPTEPETPNPSDKEEKKGCKKDLTILVIAMISLSTIGVFLKKRER
jgi:hypothetical protein